MWPEYEFLQNYRRYSRSYTEGTEALTIILLALTVLFGTIFFFVNEKRIKEQEWKYLLSFLGFVVGFSYVSTFFNILLYTAMRTEYEEESWRYLVIVLLGLFGAIIACRNAVKNVDGKFTLIILHSMNVGQLLANMVHACFEVDRLNYWNQVSR